MNHASLFSGIGGAEVAASMMGWQNLFHCEIQEFPRKVLQYWFPNSESYEDITKTDFHQWEGKVDVLTGGFPCQPFSVAGRRKGEDDNRYLGHRCYERFGRLSPLGSLVKTLLESEPWWSPAKRLKWDAQAISSKRITYTERKAGSHSKKSAKNLKQQDIPSNRLIFQLAVSEHHTKENASGLLPTVQTQGLKRCNMKGKTEFMPLDLLPTPTATDKGSGRINRSSSPGAAERPTLVLAAIQGLLPTPCATEATKFTKTFNPNSQMGKSLTALAISGMIPSPSSKKKTSGKTFQLNPLYVEEMMGFPLMWTALPFLSLNGEQNQ